jgi:chemotaxis protein methyltransferase CheR
MQMLDSLPQHRRKAHPAAPAPAHAPAAAQDLVSEREFLQISDLVYRHCGINLHDGKKELVQARLAKKLRTGGFTCVRDYIDGVLADPTGERFADLIDSLSTNLTSFFRENQHFEYLSRVYLPQLAQKPARDGHKAIRAWSAGCSSGEEPYTMAMVLDESLGSRGFDLKILATDISRKVLAAARRGVYDAARVESVPAQIRHRYFSRAPQPGLVQVSPHLQGMIRFNYLNLQSEWPFRGPLDFIFCRNVMIYFDKPTQQRLVNRFHDCLAPGGLLFTGHSESLTGITHPLRYVQPTIYAKS